MTRIIPQAQGAYHTSAHMAARVAEARRTEIEQARAFREARDPAPAPAPRAMQRNAVVQLHVGGHIRTEQLRAAQEIERMYYVSTAGVRGRITASYWERTPMGPPADDWAESTRIAYTERYAPWATWAGQRVVRGRTYREITLLLCADNLSPDQIRSRTGLHEVTARRHLQISLLEYAMIAGWVDPPSTEINLLDPSGVSA